MGYYVDYCLVSELMKYYKNIKDIDVEVFVVIYFNEYDYDVLLEDKLIEVYQKVWNVVKVELVFCVIFKVKGVKGFIINFDDLG